jgi:cell division protein FtsQ
MNALPVRHRSYTAPTSLRRRGNPYFKDRRADKISSSTFKNNLAKLPPRFWLWFFILIILAGALAWFLLFSDFLLVKKIEVRGASLIPSSSVENMAYERLERRRLLILSEEKLMVFHSDALIQDLRKRYALDDVKVVKRLPSTLIITLSEKIPVAVWFEADAFYQVDKDGWLLAFADGQLEELPTIHNNGMPKISEQRVVGMESSISFAQKLSPEFAIRFSSIPVRQLSVDNDFNTLKLVPQKGAMIYFATDDSITAQLDRLDILLSTELKGRFEKIRYIDLRFKDKLYYQ